MFDWDSRKAKNNRLKHEVSFEEAATAFLDPDVFPIDYPETAQKGSEARRARRRRAEAYLYSTLERGD
jgi:uncharacterized DUF497 family protein